MVNLTVAFVAGIGVGVIYEVLQWNFLSAQNRTANSNWSSSSSCWPSC